MYDKIPERHLLDIVVRIERLTGFGRHLGPLSGNEPKMDDAWERLMELGFRNVHFRYGDGTIGWPDAAPFDRILITAGAPELPREFLLSNLKDADGSVTGKGGATGPRPAHLHGTNHGTNQ